MIRAIILVGGPTKTGSFGPFESTPPIAGKHLVEHITDKLNVKEVVCYGFYEQCPWKDVNYIQENSELGTGGSLALHIDELFEDVDDILVHHGDVCSDIDIQEFYKFHKEKQSNCSLVTTAQPNNTSKYGCFIMDKQTNKLIHHAEKPNVFVSDLINCGIYLFNKNYKQVIKDARTKKIQEIAQMKPCLQYISQPKDLDPNYLSLERDIIQQHKDIYLYELKSFWTQVKNEKDLLNANKQLMKSSENYELRSNNVLVHKSNDIDSSIKLGPNVTIGAYCKLGQGVRIKNSILLDNVQIKNYTYIDNCIVGNNCVIGYWCRLEGDQRICVLGNGVNVQNELNVRNSIASKKITRNCENEYIL